MTFTATIDQRRALEGLAYWAAEQAYTRERFPADVDMLRRADETICMSFDVLDRLQVPYWVQNTVLCWAQNWRNTKTDYLWRAMATHNIDL